MHDVTKFPCFTHHLLQSIPQSAEIETKYTGLQKKKKNSHNSFKVGPIKSNNTYDGLQKLVTRQSYSGHIFVKVTFQGSLFVNNDQHKILDLMVYNLLGFRNFDFWP